MSKKTYFPNGPGKLHANRSFTQNYVNEEKYLCSFFSGRGSGSDAQSASYRDNMIKLNSMISHTFF